MFSPFDPRSSGRMMTRRTTRDPAIRVRRANVRPISTPFDFVPGECDRYGRRVCLPGDLVPVAARLCVDPRSDWDVVHHATRCLTNHTAAFQTPGLMSRWASILHHGGARPSLQEDIVVVLSGMARTTPQTPLSRNFISGFVQLMSSRHNSVVQRTVTVTRQLIDGITDGVSFRDALIDLEMIPALHSHMLRVETDSSNSWNCIKEVLKAFIEFCGAAPPPELGVVRPLVKDLGRLVHAQDARVRCDALRILAYIVGDEGFATRERALLVLDEGILPAAVRIIATQDYCEGAVDFLTNLAGVDDGMMDIVVEAGALAALARMFTHYPMRSAGWKLCRNIAASSPRHATAIIEAGLSQHLIERCGDFFEGTDIGLQMIAMVARSHSEHVEPLFAVYGSPPGGNRKVGDKSHRSDDQQPS